MEAAEVHLLLSDRNRRRILELVLAGAPTVTDLVRATRLRQPLVSHHLRALRAAGAVIAIREGRYRRYKPASPEVVKALGDLARAAEGFAKAGAAAAEAPESAKPAPKAAPRLRK